jgi:DNA polymerase
MTNLLRPGRLEVETDLLLGVAEVLLPSGFSTARSLADTVAAHGTAALPATLTGKSQSVVGARAPQQRGFDADLFAPKPNGGTTSAPRDVPTSASRDVPTSASRDVPTSAPREATPAQEAVTPIVDRIAPPAGETRAERLAALDRIHTATCPHCTNATGHTNLVFGEGNPDAELVFVGESPSDAEDRAGRPFVGPAGEKLDEMITAMGLRREDVYMASVLKSRPPNNRAPLSQEVDRCGPYLLAQLAIIRPKAIVTLGGPATKLLLATELGITRLRGVPASITLGTAGGSPFEAPVMPTLHPAYLLRNYTVETRLQVWSDLKQALAMIGREPPRKA